jgi:putative ABC transport system substrate-binding protein
VPRIGVLLLGPPARDPNLAALLAGLQDLGYVDGRTAALDVRSAEGKPERARELTLRLAAGKPDVLVVLGGDLVAFVREAAGSLPVVMLTSQDPVEAGVIRSFARPGGTLTGVAFVAAETAGKRLQFLKEAMPSLTRLAVLWQPDHPDGEYRNAEAAARQLGIRLQSLEVRGEGDFEPAFEAATRGRAEALMVISSRFMNLNRPRVLEFAARRRLPVVTGWGPWARAGSLMSYGPDLNVLVRRAAVHVDKILKGARPGDLPVEQPTKFELVVNLKAARALGLSLPPALLARADQVLE